MLSPYQSVSSMGPMPTPTGYSVTPSPGAGFNHLYNHARPGGQVPPMPPGAAGWGPGYAQQPGYAQHPGYAQYGARPPYGGAPAGHPNAGFPPPPGAGAASAGGFPQPPAPKQDIPDAPNSAFPLSVFFLYVLTFVTNFLDYLLRFSCRTRRRS